MGPAKTTQTSVNKVELPEWLNKGAEQTWQGATAAAAANPVTGYTGQITSGPNANMLDAMKLAAQTAGAGQGDLDWARKYAMQGGGQSFDEAAAKQYMSPYTGQVQNSVLDQMKRQGAQQIEGMSDQAQASKAYGGARHGVAESLTRDGQTRNMYDYLASSQQAAYENAQGQFERDRQAKFAAGNQFSGLAGLASNLRGADISALLQTGAAGRLAENEGLAAKYQEFLRMQDAPMQRYMQLMGMLSGAPSDRSTSGTTTTGQGNNLLSQLIGGGMMGLSMISDRKAKRDIRRVGTLAGGLGLYLFRYAWDRMRRHVGVMADEVAPVIPDAVQPAIMGVHTVDYARVMAEAAINNREAL